MKIYKNKSRSVWFDNRLMAWVLQIDGDEPTISQLDSKGAMKWLKGAI